MRWEANGALRNTGNPMGRNSDSVWRVNTGNYKGSHPATFPPELVRRMIVSSCDDDSVVLDIFGGAGTTAMVALQLGHRAVTIDINPSYTNEARLRIEADAMTDGQPSVRADTGVRPVQTNIIDLTVALKQGRERKKPKKIVPIRRRAAASRAAKPGRKRA
jgi:hypothetical protein